ncbi:MAG TPA: transcription elongation factor Spt5 [Thermoprotei archaeon]|nr:transcription elongation factor Spt5 [Thermoprotei archaeon]
MQIIEGDFLAGKVRFFAVRTTIGQEYNVSLLMEERAKASKIEVHSLAVVSGLRGIVIVETDIPHVVHRLSYGIKHVKGVIRGGMNIDDIIKFIAPRPVIEMVKVDDLVEITSGPFIGMKGRVVQIDKSRGEVKVEIAEAAYPLPITINAEYIKIIGRKEETESGVET